MLIFVNSEHYENNVGAISCEYYATTFLEGNLIASQRP